MTREMSRHGKLDLLSGFLQIFEKCSIRPVAELVDVVYKERIPYRIFPQRVESANTHTALRTKGFNIVIAPGLDGKAEGFLYLDDVESLVPDAVSEIEFKYVYGTLSMTGSFEYDAGVSIESVTLLGASEAPKRSYENVEYDRKNQKRVVNLEIPLTGPREVKIV